MAKNGEKMRGSAGWQWTNERHLNFLNSMEASFVNSMLHNNNRSRFPPLRRYLPDAADSTLSFSESSGRKTEKKTRNIASQKSSQDQVVPQIPSQKDDKDKDERDPFDVSIGTAH